MSDNKMTPEWVVENFLPEYKKRYDLFLSKCFKQQNSAFSSLYTFKELQYWYRDNFPEALENLLKAQRESCAESWHSAIAEVSEPYFESVNKAIRNAPIPEPIKEIEHFKEK